MCWNEQIMDRSQMTSAVRRYEGYKQKRDFSVLHYSNRADKGVQLCPEIQQKSRKSFVKSCNIYSHVMKHKSIPKSLSKWANVFFETNIDKQDFSS